MGKACGQFLRFRPYSWTSAPTKIQEITSCGTQLLTTPVFLIASDDYYFLIRYRHVPLGQERVRFNVRQESMQPLYNAPSWGSVGAFQSWFLVAALMLYSPAVTLPLIVWITFSVTVCAVWRKRPTLLWRTFLGLSILCGVLLSLFVAPQNQAIELDGFIATPLLVWTVYVGMALGPLALVSCAHTAFTRFRSR